VRCWVDSR